MPNPDPTRTDEPLPVFVRPGDGRDEVDRLVREAGPGSGFEKYFYVARADQTVVMVAGREVPLAALLRARPGWTEPG